jgi:hypothetical protein
MRKERVIGCFLRHHSLSVPCLPLAPFDQKMADPVLPLTPDTLAQLKAFISVRGDIGKDLTI